MQFTNRNQFIQAASSEKITLAHIEGKTRLYVFTGPTSNVYTKQVPYFVSKLKQDDQVLTKVNEVGDVVEGTFHYDIETSTLSVFLFEGVSPETVELIVTYKFFYASKGLTVPYDLQDISEDVFYQGRIMKSPGYKHKIGIDQSLTSLVGEGTLQLENNDGKLDDIFDKIIFENQQVTIYSWNPELAPSEARVIYRGQVTNKKYDTRSVSFKIKDQIFNLLDSPSISQYTSSDNVTDSVQGRFKRRVYGRVDGLRVQSIDQIGNGYTLTGTVSAAAESLQLNGTGTSFLSETRQSDKIIIGTQEFEIEEVNSDTLITLSDETAYAFAGQTAVLEPSRGVVNKNREFLATGHVCAEVQTTVTNALQFNRIIVADTTGLFPGDFIEFVDTGERIEIKTVAPGNIVVLQQNVVEKPVVGSIVIRRPIQEVYYNSQRVNAEDYTINNSITGCGLTLSDDLEFNLARPRNSQFSGTFTNGSRVVSLTVGDVSPSEVFEPGDWIKPDNVNYTTFYQVVNVKDSSVEISVAFSDATITDTVEYKSPQYIEDDSILSVNILGKTVDGTASGQWIYSASQTIQDLIEDIGITEYNSASFAEGLLDSPQTISMSVPEGFNNKTPPTVKDLVDKITKSVYSSLTLDNNLLLKFKTLNVVTGTNISTIRDYDVKDWKIQTTNGKTYKTVFSKYRFTDTDLSTLDDGNKALSFDSQFVDRYIGTNKVDELDLYLYGQRDAEIATHRWSYYNRLSVATLTIETDLRLEDNEIGEVVIADFQRLYKRFGSNSHRKKIMVIIGKTVTGESTQLILSDLGNTFNSSSFITENDAVDYNVAENDDKLINGYITNGQGIVDNDEDTANIHLIS